MCTYLAVPLISSLDSISPCLQASPWYMAMTHTSGGQFPRAAGRHGWRHCRPRVVSAATAAAEACLLQSACQVGPQGAMAHDFPVPGDLSTRSLSTSRGHPSRPFLATSTPMARGAAAHAGTEQPTPAPLAPGRLYSGGTGRRGVSPVGQQGHSKVLPTDLQQMSVSATQVCMPTHHIHMSERSGQLEVVLMTQLCCMPPEHQNPHKQCIPMAAAHIWCLVFRMVIWRLRQPLRWRRLRQPLRWRRLRQTPPQGSRCSTAALQQSPWLPRHQKY